MSQICNHDNCNNPVFKNLDKCALHCEKNDYQTDKLSNLLFQFNELLIQYIANKVEKNSLQAKYDIKKLTGNREKISEENSYLLFNSFTQFEFEGSFIDFENIVFPCRDNKDKPQEDFFCILNLFNNIHFEECSFYYHNFLIDNVSANFDNCRFLTKYTYTIYPISGLLDSAVFEHCQFNCKIEIIPYTYYDANENQKLLKEFKSSLFLECDFSQNIIIKDIIFENYLFSISDISSKININSLEIVNTIFVEKLKLNKLYSDNLIIEDCHFESKLEIKNSEITNFQFLNSNVAKIFTAKNSKFKQFKMEESIFEDFAGFEKAVFGENNKDYLSFFTYVTFKNFSNFREAEFLSGLDLSRVNLKEQPNFLNVYVEPKNTNRETFRIIKNSFDKNGNHIEANNYFIQEMQSYKRELKNTKGQFSTKLVVYGNDIISSFGQSYWKPLFILLGSIAIYSVSTCLQKNYYIEKSSKFYFLINFLNQSSKNFLPFAKFFETKSGIEFISLLFYVWFLVLIWQIIIAIKRKVIRE